MSPTCHSSDVSSLTGVATAPSSVRIGTASVSSPTGVATAVVFQFISLAREAAWRNAEALVLARTPEARARVAAVIEAESAASARLLLTAQSYLPPLTTSKPRDAWCEVHHSDPAPMAYPFGMPRPYGP